MMRNNIIKFPVFHNGNIVREIVEKTELDRCCLCDSPFHFIDLNEKNGDICEECMPKFKLFLEWADTAEDK